MSGPVIVAAVEGIVDEAVVQRLIACAGGQPGAVYGKQGKPFLQKQFRGYCNAARHASWIVLVDLDSDAACAPSLGEAWLPKPVQNLCLRIAVREIEAWLMADAPTLAPFLGVSRNLVPSHPERLLHPKEAMVKIARRSRSRSIRADMVPRLGSGRQVGPAYTSRLIEYIQYKWRPEEAAQHAKSLESAVACLRRLVAGNPDSRSRRSPGL